MATKMPKSGRRRDRCQRPWRVWPAACPQEDDPRGRYGAQRWRGSSSRASRLTPKPSATLPMESFPAIVVFGLLLTSIPNSLLLTTLFTILVRELESTRMPWSVSGLPITWFFAIVVLTLLPKTIPLATLPVIRFPTTVALRAAATSITNAVLSPFPLILKPRIVNPDTLTSLTRCPVSSPVLIFTSPRTQIASGPKVLRAGRVCLGSGGRFDHGVLSAQLYPVLADHHVLSVNSPDHDSVARMGSVYGLLDGLRQAQRPSFALRRSRSPPPVPPRLPPTRSEPWWPTTLWCVS